MLKKKIWTHLQGFDLHIAGGYTESLACRQYLVGSSSFLQVSRTCMKAWMSSNFGKFATELRPLIDVRIWFLLNILKTNRPIKTKFCIHIIIDKIYVGIVNHCFSQICKRVTALD